MPPLKKSVAVLSLSGVAPDNTATLSTAGTKAKPGAKIVSWRLAYGDGSGQPQTPGAPFPTIPHVYSPGTYTATLTIKDSTGVEISTTAEIAIIARTPAPVPEPEPQPEPIPPPSGGTGVIAPSDLVWLRSFHLPILDEYTYGSGLALRYRDGVPRLLVATYGNPAAGGAPGRIREISIPTGNVPAGTYEIAIETRNWGDCVQNKLFDSVAGLEGLDQVGNANNNFCPIQGLAEIDGVLYLFFQNFYESVGDAEPSNNAVIASVLNDATGKGTAIGAWKLSPRGGQTPPFSTFGNRWALGATRIPDAFANAYTGGRTLGIGFGHNSASIIASGPLSVGPALVAIHPPDLAHDPNRGYITRGLVPIVLHPFHADAVSAPYRALRPATNIINSMGQLHTTGPWDSPNDPYFTPIDYSGGGVWIDGPNKQGFITFETLAGGRAAGVIQSSPAPTATTFTVDNPGDIGVGDVILATTNGTVANSLYPYAKCRVSAIAGNSITVEAIKTDAQTFLQDTTAFRVGGECFCGTKYVGGGGIASRWTNAIRIYDPANLALAAQGLISYGSVPSVVQEIQFPGMPYPLRPAMGEASPMQVRGVTQDRLTRRVYVRTQAAQPFSLPLVHEYALVNV